MSLTMCRGFLALLTKLVPPQSPHNLGIEEPHTEDLVSNQAFRPITSLEMLSAGHRGTLRVWGRTCAMHAGNPRYQRWWAGVFSDSKVCWSVESWHKGLLGLIYLPYFLFNPPSKSSLIPHMYTWSHPVFLSIHSGDHWEPAGPGDGYQNPSDRDYKHHVLRGKHLPAMFIRKQQPCVGKSLGHSTTFVPSCVMYVPDDLLSLFP